MDISPHYLSAMLVYTGAAQDHCTCLAIDLCDLCIGSDTIPDIDRGEEMKIHIGSQESPQPTQVGEQAGSEETGNNTMLELGGAAIYLIGVQRIDIPGGTNKQGDIRFSEGAGKGDFIPQRGGTDDSFW